MRESKYNSLRNIGKAIITRLASVQRQTKINGKNTAKNNNFPFYPFRDFIVAVASFPERKCSIRSFLTNLQSFNPGPDAAGTRNRRGNRIPSKAPGRDRVKGGAINSTVHNNA